VDCSPLLGRNETVIWVIPDQMEGRAIQSSHWSAGQGRGNSASVHSLARGGKDSCSAFLEMPL
jgi:hypothetical protein